MPEVRQKTEKSEEPVRVEPVRVIEKDMTQQLVEKANDLQELERRISNLQSDVSQLASLASGPPGRLGAPEPSQVRLATPYFGSLARFGLIPSSGVASPPNLGSPLGLGGGSHLSNPIPLTVGGEAMTTRDLNTLPYVTRQPGVNIVDAGDQFVVQVELPATKKKDLELLGSDRSITVTATVRPDPEAGEGTVLLAECAPTVYRRTIHLPALCNTAKSRASLKDGILTLNVPKKDPSNGLRRIDVAYG